ncbi:hypothetical protein CIB48_g4764 [Xylaria polymorpha]|nr:hypothetical protein CIB48_g4764 [Xylaria polymorpha]
MSWPLRDLSLAILSLTTNITLHSLYHARSASRPGTNMLSAPRLRAAVGLLGLSVNSGVVPTTSISITTVVVPTTITSPVSCSTIIPTVTTSVEEECPTTCSIVAGTVRLFFWPTNNDYTYPSTYVETGIDYTFTSPSVYLVINTIYGTNSIGRAGPSGTSEVFAVDLDQVSTILPGKQITRQLTLDDLHTDCPQSLDPGVVATTIPDGHCDFSLLAPETVKQWALPQSNYRPNNGTYRIGN